MSKYKPKDFTVEELGKALNSLTKEDLIRIWTEKGIYSKEKGFIVLSIEHSVLDGLEDDIDLECYSGYTANEEHTDKKMNSVKLKDLLKSYLSGKINFKELKDGSVNSDIQDLCEAYYDEEVSKKFFEGELLKIYNSIFIDVCSCPICGDKASVKIEHVESGFWHPPGSEEAKKLNAKGFDGNRRHPLTSEICQECYMKIFNTGMYYSRI